MGVLARSEELLFKCGQTLNASILYFPKGQMADHHGWAGSLLQSSTSYSRASAQGHSVLDAPTSQMWLTWPNRLGE